MSKITTEDCKQYLTEQFPELSAKDWKRTRKYKDDNSCWCRDFSHKTGITTTLIEVDGKLCISDSEKFAKKEIEIKDPSKVLYYKKFDDSLVKAAKKIVKKYTDYEDDEFEVSPEMKGYDAIPNLISFFFLGEYPPDTKITKEISFNMDFSIFFSPVTDKYFDQHLQPLIADFIPEHFGEECECEFAPFYENEDEALTIREIMQKLLDRGFIYDVKRCDLQEYFKDYTIIPKS